MRHKSSITTCALALGAALATYAAPQTAEAGKDMRGRFGLGGGRTLSGYSQLSGRYFVITNFSVGLGFGVGVYDPNEQDVDDDVVALGTVSPEFLGWFLVTKEDAPVAANLGLGGRIGFVFGSDGDSDDGDGTEDPFEIDIEIPVVMELYVGEHFSIAPEVGFVFRIVPGESPDDSNDGAGCSGLSHPTLCAVLGGRGPGFGFEMGHNAGFFGGGSFRFYF